MRLSRVAACKTNGCLGTRSHHHHKWPELFQHRAIALASAKVTTQIKHAQVPPGIAHHGFVFLQRKERHVAVIDLHPLVAQGIALL